MVYKTVLFLFFLKISVFSVNFYPLPKVFTNTIRISPEYRIFNYANIDLSSVGGSVKDTAQGMGIGLKWGAPFNGFEFIYQSFNNDYIANNESIYRTTSIGINIYKLRWYLPLISDQSSIISAYISVGQYSGNYSINSYTEASGSVGLIERYQTGIVGDFGIVIGYTLNKEWSIYLSPSYQITSQDQLTDPVGVDSDDPVIAFKGAALALGTSIKL